MRYKMTCGVYKRREMIAGLLGKGAFSEVFISKKDPNKAIKVLTERNNITMAEVAILKSMKHKNVMNLTELCFIDDKLSYIMDRSKFSFEKFVLSSRYEFRNVINKLCKDICLGLDYLHTQGFLHLDISLTNCLVFNGVAKIADFSLSLYTDDVRREFKSRHDRITCTFRPYENLDYSNANRRVYSDKSDIWSLGVVLASVLSGNRLINYDREIVKYKNKKNHDMSVLVHIEKLIAWDSWPIVRSKDEWKDVITDMLSIDKQKRPSIRDVIRSLNLDECTEIIIDPPDINDYINKEWYTYMSNLLTKNSVDIKVGLFSMKLFHNIEECFEFPDIYEGITRFGVEYWMIGCVRIIDKLFCTNNKLSFDEKYIGGEDMYTIIEENILKWRDGVII